MGCFEISNGFRSVPILLTINFNMGCFEINEFNSLVSFCYRLTLTWDVLKSPPIFLCTNGARLTLTWDVLKLRILTDSLRLCGRLTLTWDVLKSSAVLASTFPVSD